MDEIQDIKRRAGILKENVVSSNPKIRSEIIQRVTQILKAHGSNPSLPEILTTYIIEMMEYSESEAYHSGMFHKERT